MIFIRNHKRVFLLAIFFLGVRVMPALAVIWNGGTGLWVEKNNWSDGVLPYSSSYVTIDNGEAQIGETIIVPGGTATLNASDDASILSNNPSQNTGSWNWVGASHSVLPDGEHHTDGYIKFRLNSIPSEAIITNATLDLKVWSANPGNMPSFTNVGLYLALNDNWSESTLTWNSPTGPGLSQGISSLPIANLSTVNDFPVNNYVISEALNTDSTISFGLSVSGGNDCSALFYSKEGGYSPKLIVDYDRSIRDANSGSVQLGGSLESSGKITQTAGQLTIGIRGGWGSAGWPGFLDVGYQGTGEYEQTGGNVQIFSNLSVGSSGMYNLSGGELNVNGHWQIYYDPIDPSMPPNFSVSSSWVCIGGHFNHSGGKFNVGQTLESDPGYESGWLSIGNVANTYAEYNLSGTGELRSTGVGFGYPGTGVFRQMGGSSEISSLNVAAGQGGTAIYEMSDGTLRADEIAIGGAGPGTFEISGGIAHGNRITIGRPAPGTIRILGPDAKVSAFIFSLFPGAHLEVTQGSHLTITANEDYYSNSIFRIESTNEAELVGLKDLTLAFNTEFHGGEHDGWARLALCEVAGKDYGPSSTGFHNNFNLRELIVGTDDGRTWLELMDNFDNGNRSSAEALYVHNLTIGPYSILDLKGIHLYYDGVLQMAETALIQGGAPIFVAVPEPSMIVMTLLGGISLFCFRRRYCC